MLPQNKNKRKNRDFKSLNEPSKKIQITDNTLASVNRDTVKWNPGLYTLKRFDAPLPVNKRYRELEENKTNLDDLAENLIRPLKKLHITPNITRSTFTDTPVQSPPTYLKQTPNKISPPKSPTNHSENTGNPKKVSLIEFLYSDTDEDFLRRPSEEKSGKKKSFKVSDSMGSWMGDMFCQDLSQKTDEPSNALTLYEKPLKSFQRNLMEFFEKYHTPLQWNTKTDPYPSTITVEEIDDDEEEQKKKFLVVNHPPQVKLDFIEGIEDRVKEDDFGLGFHKNLNVEEVGLDYVSWKDGCQDGFLFKKDVPYSKFEVAQKGA